MNLDFKLSREIYVALYAVNLSERLHSTEQVAQCIMWDYKTRPDMICRITGKSIVLEEHIRETCWNRAVEIAKGADA